MGTKKKETHRDVYDERVKKTLEAAEIRGSTARHLWRKWIKKHQGQPLPAAVPSLKKYP